MNTYQETLWNDLSALVERSEAFYFQDYEHDGAVYRIFNYRMASYTDFLEPSALECRGIMFDVTNLGYPELVALPQEKFFNLEENPFTMGLDLGTVTDIELKADGSLISTYMHGNELRLKSKGSIASEQAVDAMSWLGREENTRFREALRELAENGVTVNMEWTAPFNRVVISYQTPGLIVLNARRMVDGQYVLQQTLRDHHRELFDAMIDHWIEFVDVEMIGSPAEFVAAIPDMEDIEGYIIKLESGQSVKIKTHWYLVQHRAKDSINSDRRLFETVVADAHDDLRSLFYDDEWVLERISWMEGLVGEEFNHMVATVEGFYNDNKDLERKDYAIKAKAEVKPLWFGLCMSLYLGKVVDYKAFMMKQYKHYGIKDQQKADL